MYESPFGMAKMKISPIYSFYSFIALLGFFYFFALALGLIFLDKNITLIAPASLILVSILYIKIRDETLPLHSDKKLKIFTLCPLILISFMILKMQPSIESPHIYEVIKYFYIASVIILLGWHFILFNLGSEKVALFKSLIRNLSGAVSIALISILAIILFINQATSNYVPISDKQTWFVGMNSGSLPRNDYTPAFFVRFEKPVTQTSFYWKSNELSNYHPSGDIWFVGPYSYKQVTIIQDEKYRVRYDYRRMAKSHFKIYEEPIYLLDKSNIRAIIDDKKYNLDWDRSPPNPIFVAHKATDTKNSSSGTIQINGLDAYLYNQPQDTYPILNLSKLIPNMGEERPKLPEPDRLKSEFNPKTQAWAEQLKNSNLSDVEKIQKVIDFFHKNDFKYTLNPSAENSHGNTIDDFLFVHQTGYCQHYSTAFSMVLLYAGVPSRVISGFAGINKTSQPNVYSIQNKNAHAWSEAWVEGYGWIPFDLTMASRNIDPPQSKMEKILERLGQLYGKALGAESFQETDSSTKTFKQSIQEFILKNPMLLFIGITWIIIILFLLYLIKKFKNKNKKDYNNKMMLDIFNLLEKNGLIENNNSSLWLNNAKKMQAVYPEIGGELVILVRQLYEQLYGTHVYDPTLEKKLRQYKKKVKKYLSSKST